MKNFFGRAIRLPHFLYLLPLFFVFHGYAQNPAPVTLADFWLLVAQYLLAAVNLTMVGRLLLAQWSKAALFAFGLLSLHLFFGAFHDAIKDFLPGFFLGKYAVLLPLLALLVILFFVYLKRTTKNFSLLFVYLNFLLVTLLLVDIPVLLQQKATATKVPSLPSCTSCDSPDVYLIVADEYADSTSLVNIFGFNNKVFLAALRQRGFHVAESVSNYNYTPFAMASLLSMNYIPEIEGYNSSYRDRLTCASLINHNTLWDFFQKSGYELRNNSIYKIANQATVAPQAHFRLGTDFIASHTLLARVQRDLGYHLVTTLRLPSMVRRFENYMDNTNRRLLSRLRADINENSGKSKFVYTHLHMPHYPYYYKSNGSRNPAAGSDENSFNQADYIEYLQYGNRVYLQLVDEILHRSKKPPVIILMGDHGFREFKNMTPAEKKAQFMNLNAVYLPSGDYNHFYNGISGVNQFRVILNTSFGQHLPLLNDTTYFLQE